MATARSLMVVEVCVLAVSTVWTAETVIVSLTPETFILRSRLAACPTVSANSSCLMRGEALLRDGDRVAAGRELEEDEAAGLVGGERPCEIGLDVTHLDGDAGHGRALFIEDGALDDARRDLRLRSRVRGRERENEKEKAEGDDKDGRRTLGLERGTHVFSCSAAVGRRTRRERRCLVRGGRERPNGSGACAFYSEQVGRC